ncbi:hypothetical protein KQX54_012851, partial [Cotesia glomerata]
ANFECIQYKAENLLIELPLRQTPRQFTRRDNNSPLDSNQHSEMGRFLRALNTVMKQMPDPSQRPQTPNWPIQTSWQMPQSKQRIQSSEKTFGPNMNSSQSPVKSVVPRTDGNMRRCMNCGQIGHLASFCDNDRVPFCYKCKTVGHENKDCPQYPPEPRRGEDGCKLDETLLSSPSEPTNLVEDPPEGIARSQSGNTQQSTLDKPSYTVEKPAVATESLKSSQFVHDDSKIALDLTSPITACILMGFDSDSDPEDEDEEYFELRQRLFCVQRLDYVGSEEKLDTEGTPGPENDGKSDSGEAVAEEAEMMNVALDKDPEDDDDSIDIFAEMLFFRELVEDEELHFSNSSEPRSSKEFIIQTNIYAEPSKNLVEFLAALQASTAPVMSPLSPNVISRIKCEEPRKLIRVLAEVMIARHKIEALIDTGSDRTFIDSSLAEILRLHAVEHARANSSLVRGTVIGDGHVVHSSERFAVKMTLGDVEGLIWVNVLPGLPRKLILGNDTSDNFKLFVDFATLRCGSRLSTVEYDLQQIDSSQAQFKSLEQHHTAQANQDEFQAFLDEQFKKLDSYERGLTDLV